MSNSAPKHRAPTDELPEASQGARARLKRRWPRRALIGLNCLVVVCLAAMGAAYGYVRYRIDSIATVPSPDLTPTTVGHPPTGGRGPNPSNLQPENILLIGNETRQGLTAAEQLEYGSSLTYSGTLADIMMILHLDPATGAASILSVPRDLFSPMPPGSPVGSYQKMDAALNDGVDGPDNLVKAIQDDLGIPINHFIELNFNGFINTVDALGGINVYFPDPVFDAESLLYITTPGCHHLNGRTALSLVRARHLQYDPPGDSALHYDWPYDPESDLARIVRTHTFIKIVAQTAKAKGLTNLVTANNFLTAVLGQMTVDNGLKGQLINLVEQYRHLNVGAVPETTLPTTAVNDYYYGGYGVGDILFPVQPNDDKTIAAWDHEALPTPVAPKSVSVVSITGSDAAAASAGQALSSEGLKVISTSAATVPATTSETLVLYHKGDVAQALDVMKYLSGSVMMQLSPSMKPGVVEVDLGSTVAVASKPVPSTTTTAAGAATTTSGGPTTTGTGPTTTARPTTTAGPTTTGTGPTTTAGPTTTTSGHTTPISHASASTTTTVPAPDGEQPTLAADQEEPWDPRACT